MQTTVHDDDKGRGLWAWNLVKALLAVAFVIFIGIFLVNGFTEAGIRQEIRWSAKISFTLFCIAFSASGFHLWRRRSFSFWVLMNRKYWGISFALIHLIHLGFLCMLQYFFHPVFERAAMTSLLAGGIAYAFVIAMLLTSFPYFAQFLKTSHWKRLHTLGGYWIWAIFMSSYSKRLLTEWIYLPYVLALLLVLCFRYWAWKQKA